MSAALRLDYVDHDVYKAALARWYYRPETPVGKLVRVGVWENDVFVGVVSFGPGSSSDLGTRWGLTPFQICEMNRLALRSNHATPVSRVVRIAVLLLRRRCPGIQAIVTFADPRAGHHGGVYQGAGWIYTGVTAPDRRYLYRGQWVHSRNVRASGTMTVPGGKRVPCPRPVDCERVEIVPGKHRYVLPLTSTTRSRVETERRPYPKAELGGTSLDLIQTESSEHR